MYHIEFIGPSGAGKTTLIKKLRHSSLSVVTRHEGVLTCANRASKIPISIQHWPRFIQRRYLNHILLPQCRNSFYKTYSNLHDLRSILVEVSDTDNIAMQYDRVIGEHQLLTTFANNSEIVAIDDGVYQFNLPLIEHDLLKSELSEFLPLPNMLVSVQADPKTCLERQEQRKRGRATSFRGLDYNDAIHRLKSMAQASLKLTSELERKGVDIIRISTDEYNSEIYDTFVECILKSYSIDSQLSCSISSN